MNQNQMYPSGPMGGAPNNMGNNYGGVAPTMAISGQDKSLMMGFIACLVIMAIGCFLPFISINILGYSESINYIKYGDSWKDGIYLIGIGVVAAICLFKNKYMVSLILQGISTVIVGYDYFDAKDTIGSYTDYIHFGVGFYVVLIAVIGSLICAFLLWKKNKNTASKTPNPGMGYGQPQPMNNYGQPVQPQVSNNCPYCGTPKTPGSGFCSNCGAKL